MKKILSFLLLVSLSFMAQAQVTDYAGYLNVKDTLNDAQAVDHEVTITGAKSALSFQVNTEKISGTIAGSIIVFGSVDGTNWETSGIDTVSLSNASSNYVIKFTSNNYLKYRIRVATTGTSSMSERTYVLYRK